MPIGPTGRISAAGRPCVARLLDRRGDLVAHHDVEVGDRVAGNRLEAADATTAGARRSTRADCEQQASILARSQPRGRNPSIIEPANVVSRFMVLESRVLLLLDR